MADTVRQQIIDAVDTRLKTILVSNGFKTDIGNNVFWWKETPFESADLPAINCRDRTEELDDEITTFGCDGYSLPIEIKLSFEGSTSIDTAREAVNDVVDAIREDDTWSGLAVHTVVGASEMASEQAEEIETAISMLINIHYQANCGPDGLQLISSYLFDFDSEYGIGKDSNGKIVTWFGYQGTGIDLTATAESRKPSIHEGILNGYDVVFFDGEANRLDNLTAPSSMPRTDFIVFRVLSGGHWPNGTTLWCAPGWPFPMYVYHLFVTDGKGRPVMGYAGTNCYFPGSVDAWMILMIEWNMGSETYAVVNKTVSHNQDIGTAQQITGLCLGGPDQSATDFTKMEVARFLSYGKLLSTAEKNQVWDTLNMKYKVF